MARVSRCLLCFGVLASVTAFQSRFNKNIDTEKLDKEWADPEDEEWHEDSYEWKMKLVEKKRPAFNLEDLQKPGINVRDKVLEMDAGAGKMQMCFVTLKDGASKSKEQTEEFGRRWQALLRTNSALTSVYAIGDNELLVTEDNGRIMEVRDFFLSQPEVDRFRWKDTDFYAPGHPKYSPPATVAPKAGKAGKAARRAAESADKSEL